MTEEEAMAKKPLNPRLAKYVDYINNTGLAPLPVAYFDEDWEPIGPMIRSEMEKDGYIYMGGPNILGDCKEDGIYLRPDLVRSR